MVHTLIIDTVNIWSGYVLISINEMDYILKNFGPLCIKFRCMKATGGEDQLVEKREKKKIAYTRCRDEEREKEMAYLLRPGGIVCKTALHK